LIKVFVKKTEFSKQKYLHPHLYTTHEYSKARALCFTKSLILIAGTHATKYSRGYIFVMNQSIAMDKDKLQSRFVYHQGKYQSSTGLR